MVNGSTSRASMIVIIRYHIITDNRRPAFLKCGPSTLREITSQSVTRGTVHPSGNRLITATTDTT